MRSGIRLQGQPQQCRDSGQRGWSGRRSGGLCRGGGQSRRMGAAAEQRALGCGLVGVRASSTQRRAAESGSSARQRQAAAATEVAAAVSV